MLIAAARQAAPFREISDGAIIEMYTLEALRGKLLVGPYSRFGWHHPGPMFFYLLAPSYWATGLHTAGAQAGVLLVNIAAVIILGTALLRAASAPLVLVMCAAIGAYIVRVGDMVVSVWNPHAIVLPLAAFVVVAAAAAATADGAFLLWLAVLGSLLVQTHLAMAPIVAAISVPVFVASLKVVRRIWLRLAIVIIVLWMPVAVEQATHWPGNLTRIVDFFVEDAGAPAVQSVPTAVRAWATAITSAFSRQFVVAMGFDYTPTAGVIATVAATALCGWLGLAAVAERRRHPFTSWLAGLCAIATVVALAATTRIRGQIVDHEIFWMSVLGALDAAVVIARLLQPESGAALKRPAIGALIAVVAAVGAIGMAHVVHRARGVDDHNVDVIADALSDSIRTSRPKRLLVTIDPPVWPIAAGALLQLDKAGVAFAVDDRWTTMFGERFTRTGAEDLAIQISGSPLQPTVVRTR